MTRLADVAVGDDVAASIENADRAGLNRTKQLLTPTSVVGGTIGTYGAVSFAGASSVSLDGVFTAEYDWYEIEFNITTSGTASLQLVLRLAGTDATTGYDTQRTTMVNATLASAQSLNAGNFVMTSPIMAGRHSGTVKLYDPALAVATTGTILALITPNPMTTSGGTFVGGPQHRTATGYDGFTVAPSTGTITGTIRVYGLI